MARPMTRISIGVKWVGDYSRMKVGDKVIFLGSTDTQMQWGNHDDAMRYLTVNEAYTITRIEVHSWHTKLFLKGIENRCFNSVCFKEVNE